MVLFTQTKKSKCSFTYLQELLYRGQGHNGSGDYYPRNATGNPTHYRKSEVKKEKKVRHTHHFWDM